MEAPYNLRECDGTTVSRIDILDEAKNRKSCYCYRISLKVSLKSNDFFIHESHARKSCTTKFCYSLVPWFEL